MAFSFFKANQVQARARGGSARVTTTYKGNHPKHGHGERWAIHPDDWNVHFAPVMASRACGPTHSQRLEKSLCDHYASGAAGMAALHKSATEAAEYRWITVHPHGNDEHGVPVRIRKMHDGAWGIINGAGGKLNGLRLTDVKSPEEYKEAAKEKAKVRKEKTQAKEADALKTLRDNHLIRLQQEHAGKVERGEASQPQGEEETAKHEEALQLEAGKRALEERNEQRGDRANDLDEAQEQRREREQQLIAHAAQALGWKPEDYELTAEDVKAVRNNQFQRACAEAPGDADKAFKNGDEKAATRITKKADKATQRVLDRHRALVLKRAREGLGNHKDVILSATDDLAGQMGDVAVGDLVSQTLGDGGKGFVAHLTDEAIAHGLETKDARAQAEEVNWNSRLERKDGDVGKAMKAKEAVEIMQEAAAKARAQLRDDMGKLGEGEDSPLARVAALNTLPKAKPGDAAKVLAGAKALEAGISEAKGIEREIKGADPLDTLPKAAVLRSSAEMTPEEALALVQKDLGDTERERAVDALIASVNAQSRDDGGRAQPMQKHVLSGQGAFFNNVANIVGIRGVDPLTLDILGEAGAARVMASALARKFADDPAGLEGARQALEREHIETQARVAERGVENAKDKFAQAANIDVLPIEDMDSMLEGLSRNAQAMELHRQGREILGLAMGRLQAGAALNEALGRLGKDGHYEDVQISLGAVSSQDALKKAAAVGLTTLDKKDFFSGLVMNPDDSEFDVFNDGKNKILIVHPKGIDKLGGGLQESPEHLARAERSRSIKAGEQDEENWLPAGFSDRPASDVSRPDSLDVPRLDCQLSVDKWGDAGAMQDGVQRFVAQGIEAGGDPVTLAAQLRSEAFIAQHVPADQVGAWHAAVNAAIPPMRVAHGTKPKAGDYLAHQAHLDALMRGYHADHIREEAAKLGLKGQDGEDFVSLHEQSLPQTREAADLVHQVSIQDPRLRVAFKDLGDCDRADLRAVRDYAYEHVLRGPNGEQLNPKDAETPIESLSPTERAAFDKWHGLRATGAPYEAIQDALRDGATRQGGGMFDDAPAKAHPLAEVNLHDDAAVLAAAKASANELGYTLTHVGLDPKTGHYERSFVPGLETSEGQALDGVERARAAGKARDKIQHWLRERAANELWGGQAGTGKTRPNFDVDKVQTASQRWTQYVSDMGGETRAYQAVRDHMKGDFASRFVNGYRSRTGQPFRVAYVPVAHAEAHSYAVLPPDARAAQDALASSERSKMQNRTGGKFAQGGVKAGLDAKKADAAMGMALFDANEGKKAVEERSTHRVTLGGAAEAAIGGMLPNLGLRRGTVAASDINMSRGDAVKRQRSIKLIEANKRSQMSLGVGSGKTSVAQGSFSHLKAQGKVKRALMAVPSVVQEQFGSEAARFYDPTSPHFPTWFADSTASRDARRAAYHHASGNDICVVTHQSLRDDLTWAVAQNQFGGDETKARTFLADAPESQRNEAVKGACKTQGWDFDMTVVDEGHNLLNRSGKANSAMANTLDAFTHDKPYHVAMSADPVKNDASEAFDLLRKVAPERYVNDDHELAQPMANGLRRNGVITKGEFMRKYGVNTIAAKEALSREMEPYHYAESLPPDVPKTTKTHVVPMSPEQDADYKGVLKDYQQARAARLRDEVNVPAVKALSPNSFKNLPESEHEETARRLMGSLGILRDTALDRVVNLHPQGAKMQWLMHRLGLEHSKSMGERGVDALPSKDHPAIVFAHNLAAVGEIERQLQARGVPTARLDGTMSGEEKDKAKLAFSPQWDDSKGGYVTDPTAQVIICSDAGAVGWNGQRGDTVINFDTPHTCLTHEQRLGRAFRTGQRNHVWIDTVMTSSNYEKTRRKRMEDKGVLREAVTTPAELIDDSGLSLRIKRETDIARAKLMQAGA